MPGFLRQSTNSQSRILGPFVDDTDFKTAETGLTIANTDIKLMKNGGTSSNKNSGGGTHRTNGEYSITFDSTDTDTVGELTVSTVVSGALPVWDKYYVLEPVVYDALFADAAGGYITPTTTDLNAIADAILKRSVSNVEATAAEHTLATIILAMLEWSVSGTTLTIKRTDGTTTHYTKTLSTNASADPITGVN